MKIIAYPLLIISLLSLLAGCATTTLPVNHMVENQRTFDAAYDQVWTAIMMYFTENQISIRTIEKDSGIIYAEKMYGSSQQGGVFNQWADCGGGMRVSQTDIAGLNLFVRNDLTPNKTSVTINTEFRQKVKEVAGGLLLLADDAPIIEINCTSRGGLEKLVFDYIDRHLQSLQAGASS